MNRPETQNWRKSIIHIIMSTLSSGGLWYFANDLSGEFGLLMWIAPIPILLLSLKFPGWTSFLASFFAFFIGKLCWYTYLVPILSITSVLIYFTIASFIFASIVLLFRQFSLKVPKWYSVFAFPILYSVFEFLSLKFAPDGSAGSIAYSQMNYLPVVQLASITGILGITFHLCLVAAALSLCFYHYKERPIFNKIVSTALIFSLMVLLYGSIKLSQKIDEGPNVVAGLAVLDERYHHFTKQPDTAQEWQTAKAYADVANELAEKGAKIVLLPERALNITKENEKEVLALFSEISRQNRICMIIGYTNYRSNTARNSVLVIGTGGEISSHYDKSRLIKGLEDEFSPGNSPGIFKYEGLRMGTAICKDLDFPDYINRYNDIHLLVVPAWDFVADEWLHSRMAILRSVENGFSQIRSARQGLLSVNDRFGRVISEVSCSDKTQASLLANVPLSKGNTLYAKFGDWFGFMNCAAFVVLLFVLLYRGKVI
ncbi:hypothetical protein F8C76_01595 [Flagellimonas olearia]|uniref:CN hydrolase domain-containing protein n=1 Tax=Flagellimonas olearia TaxID=552546 RepID=A0A6I1E2U7_9FLAO|nr:nitrilase-related carbon-nitrogen hydrolase [Allomuricauda olearia]KAB7530230.1 hypothetical protein F8C76_01595 [Allomuricauda olearia]